MVAGWRERTWGQLMKEREKQRMLFSVLGAQLIEVSLTEEDRKERSQVLGKQE